MSSNEIAKSTGNHPALVSPPPIWTREGRQIRQQGRGGIVALHRAEIEGAVAMTHQRIRLEVDRLEVLRTTEVASLASDGAGYLADKAVEIATRNPAAAPDLHRIKSAATDVYVKTITGR